MPRRFNQYLHSSLLVRLIFDAYTDDDLSFLGGLANVAAIAIGNSRLD